MFKSYAALVAALAAGATSNAELRAVIETAVAIIADLEAATPSPLDAFEARLRRQF